MDDVYRTQITGVVRRREPRRNWRIPTLSWNDVEVNGLPLSSQIPVDVGIAYPVASDCNALEVKIPFD